ncbi:MAG: SH3 domain-containing protein [Planctomycetes bacterium]|jgi:SH3-like domain-containing protein|nr:SH3 domain-containing protein [Planctomycetota bacterium]
MKTKVLIALLAVSAGAATMVPMSVQVRSGKVYPKPSYLGTVIATVEYGAQVQAGTLEKGWYPVTTADGKSGWLHESALSKKRIVMRAGTTDVGTGVSSDEVALAGKGFNAQVEAKLRQEGKLDYTWVDRMSEMKVEMDAVAQFLTQGHLAGGAQ